jgi:sugar phosphate isomerase/epimerase
MMHMGLLTNSLTGVGVKDLHEIACWAAEHQITELEIGPAIPMDKKLLNDVLNKGRVKIGAMIYCRNYISEDEAVAKEHSAALKARIEFAGDMGIGKVVCSAGQRKESVEGLDFKPEKSIDASVAFFSEMVELAEKKNVKLCFEMCPWMWNIACAPNVWDMLFDRIKSDKLGLCYDPSHLVWQMIDPYRVLKEYRSKIFHVHGKDTEIDREKLSRYGVLQNVKWWRHRLPGLGELDWRRIVDILYEIGYDGVISIEHEDPVWEGSEEKVKTGILISRDHIARFLV